jgi:hypothetical protein
VLRVERELFCFCLKQLTFSLYYCELVLNRKNRLSSAALNLATAKMREEQPQDEGDVKKQERGSEFLLLEGLRGAKGKKEKGNN